MGVTLFKPQRNLKQKLVGEVIFYSEVWSWSCFKLIKFCPAVLTWDHKIGLDSDSDCENSVVWRDRWHNAALASLSFPYHNWVLVLSNTNIINAQNFKKEIFFLSHFFCPGKSWRTGCEFFADCCNYSCPSLPPFPISGSNCDVIKSNVFLDRQLL